MPQGPSYLLIILIVLVILSGLFSATETAYSCLNKLKLKSMMSNGNKQATRVYNLCEKFESLITTILIGNNIVNLTAAAVSGFFFAEIMHEGADSSAVSTAVLTVVILIFGEITPKFLAKSNPEKAAMGLYPFIIFFYTIFYPLNIVFRGYQKLIAMIFKVKEEDPVTDEQIKTLVDEAEEAGTLEEDESDLVRSALEFRDSEAGDIIVPRVKIEAVSVHADFETIRKKFSECVHSRLIVYEDSIDNVLGFIHEKDFYKAYLNGDHDLQKVIRQAVTSSEHTKISDLLKTMQGKKCSIATIFDEYGGLLGIVSLEDIFEELVGEIWDEHDDEEKTIQKVSDTEYVVSGECNVDTFFEEADVSVDEEEDIDSNTMGGWITELFERVPSENESVNVDNLHIEVLQSTDKQVLSAKISIMEESDEEESSGDGKETKENKETKGKDSKESKTKSKTE